MHKFLLLELYFNPLPRKEGDPSIEELFLIYDISIHSLVKRETVSRVISKSSNLNFNPLPRKEGDLH